MQEALVGSILTSTCESTGWIGLESIKHFKVSSLKIVNDWLKIAWIQDQKPLHLVIIYLHHQIFMWELWFWYTARACVNRGSCEGKQPLPVRSCNLI